MSFGDAIAEATVPRLIPEETTVDLNQLDESGLKVEIQNEISRRAGLAENDGFFSGWTIPAVLAGTAFGFFLFKYLSK